MQCVAEKENLGAAILCAVGGVAGIAGAPGWWKLAAVGGFLGCLLWIDSARRQVADCLRAAGRTAEADILEQQGQQLQADIAYLQSLGVQAA